MSDYKMNALEQKLFDNFFITDKYEYLAKPLSDMCVKGYKDVRPEVVLSALACKDSKRFADITDVLARLHGLKLSHEAQKVIADNMAEKSHTLNNGKATPAYKTAAGKAWLACEATKLLVR